MGVWRGFLLFRQKLSLHTNMKWGVKDVGLWLNLMLSQRSQFQSKQTSNAQEIKRAHCRYKHECSFCSGGFLCFGALKTPINPLLSNNLVRSLQKATTPVIWERTAPWLRAYPNKQVGELLLDGFEYVRPDWGRSLRGGCPDEEWREHGESRGWP